MGGGVADLLAIGVGPAAKHCGSDGRWGIPQSSGYASFQGEK